MKTSKHNPTTENDKDPAAEAVRPAQPGDPAGQTAADALEILKRECEQLREENLRHVAEARNLRQRLTREKDEALKYAEANLARELLVILDDLERTQAAQNAADAQAVLQGVKITYEHFLKLLRDHHVEPVPAEGRPFDPDRHEALLQEPSRTHPAGTVVRELARGYKMHDRILRPARVAVSSGPPPGGK